MKITKRIGNSGTELTHTTRCMGPEATLPPPSVRVKSFTLATTQAAKKKEKEDCSVTPML